MVGPFETVGNTEKNDGFLCNVKDATDRAEEATTGLPKKMRHRILRGIGISPSSSLNRLVGSSSSTGYSHNKQGSASYAHVPIQSQASPISDLTSPLFNLEEILTPPNIAYQTSDAEEVEGLNDISRVAKADYWAILPFELKILVLSFIGPLELVRISRVSRSMYQACFDGQVWKSVDVSHIRHRMTTEELTRLLVITASPCVRNINLRGCGQVTTVIWTRAILERCHNLRAVSIEGCPTINHPSIIRLGQSNTGLTSLDLTGLGSVTNTTCRILASLLPQLEMVNLSYCRHVRASALTDFVKRCQYLRDLRAASLYGFENLDFAKAIFATNRLERLVLTRCTSLMDDAFKVMIHGTNLVSGTVAPIPKVPVRRLRHLDLGGCWGLSDDAIQCMAHFVPNLEGLVLSRSTLIHDYSLGDIIESTPKLAFIELTDLPELTDEFFKKLAKSPCASNLRHLSVSGCTQAGDPGILPVVTSCTSLESLVLDNTLVSDISLDKATEMVNKRLADNMRQYKSNPQLALHIDVYDCDNISAQGIQRVLFANVEREKTRLEAMAPTPGMIRLKCCRSYQQVVDEHMRRLGRGDFDGAHRLNGLWAAYLECPLTCKYLRRYLRRCRRVQNSAGRGRFLCPDGTQGSSKQHSYCGVM